MEQELLQALAEAKSYIKEWAKQDKRNARWLTLANDIARLQLELAPKPETTEMASDMQELDEFLKDQDATVSRD